MTLVRGEAPAHDAVVTTDPGTLLAHRRRDLADALAAEEIAIEGDARVVARFLGLFTMLEPVASAA